MSRIPLAVGSTAAALVFTLLNPAMVGASAPTAAKSPATAPTAPTAPVVTKAPAAADIQAQITAIPGVTDVKEGTAPAGYRFFTMNFTQPVDHNRPALGTFKQRITLLHRDAARPMVMYTSGYNVSSRAGRSEPTQLVDGNQISMEYRFFTPSRPDNPHWTQQLTIKQAAADQHRIIRAFKRVYDKKWLTTGGSKGGMTATYHRRFYPHDVDGTIAYVAPNDVVDRKDVYNTFLDQVSDDQTCRDDLTALQRKVLTEREWFLDKTKTVSDANGYTYDIVGSMDMAMESSVVDMYFAFWQYSPQSACADVPDAETATNQEVWDFFSWTSPLTGYADQSVTTYVPYYFQASYQLGSPEPYETRIGDLLKYPGADVASTFVPDELLPQRFDHRAMPDINRWVSKRSTEMLFIYGSNDPWSAEPFECGRKAVQRECSRYYVAGGTHGSSIGQLPFAERTRASALVLKWAGLGEGDKATATVRKTGKADKIKGLDRKQTYLRRGGM